MNNLNLISPEIFISLSIMFLLILGVFKKNSSSLIHNLSIGLLLITGVLILNNPFDSPVTLFGNSYLIDNLSTLMKILITVGGAFILSISSKYLRISQIFLIEYPILILCSILGMMVMISSNDLMVFYI
jgi:NADH-quinone oxidoreductase subunit N